MSLLTLRCKYAHSLHYPQLITYNYLQLPTTALPSSCASDLDQLLAQRHVMLMREGDELLVRERRLIRSPDVVDRRGLIRSCIFLASGYHHVGRPVDPSEASEWDQRDGPPVEERVAPKDLHPLTRHLHLLLQSEDDVILVRALA